MVASNFEVQLLSTNISVATISHQNDAGGYAVGLARAGQKQEGSGVVNLLSENGRTLASSRV